MNHFRLSIGSLVKNTLYFAELQEHPAKPEGLACSLHTQHTSCVVGLTMLYRQLHSLFLSTHTPRNPDTIPTSANSQWNRGKKTSNSASTSSNKTPHSWNFLTMRHSESKFMQLALYAVMQSHATRPLMHPALLNGQSPNSGVRPCTTVCASHICEGTGLPSP